MMNNNATIEKLRAMKLHGMQQAFISSLETRCAAEMTPDEFIAWLTEAEWNQRSNRKIASRIKTARFRYASSLEEMDYSTSRNLDKNIFKRLADCSFIERKENLILTGATGLGYVKLMIM
jgi:DNA replication protein DnaC